MNEQQVWLVIKTNHLDNAEVLAEMIDEESAKDMVEFFKSISPNDDKFHHELASK